MYFTFDVEMKKILLILPILFTFQFAQAQKFDGLRLSGIVALSFPTEPFSQNDHPLNDTRGYALPGLYAGVSGEIFLSKHWSFGMRGGYSIYEFNESEYQKELEKGISEDHSINVSATPYQTLNLLGQIEFSQFLFKDKLDINPYLGIGLGILRTSERSYTLTDTMDVVVENYNRRSEVQSGFQMIPGLAFNYAILSFLELRVFGEYMMSDHRLTETSTLKTPATETTVIRSENVDYNLRAFNVGGGLSLRF